jgi:uncharacterized protein (UPF0147 family)
MLIGSVRGWIDQQPLSVIQASTSYVRDAEQDVEPIATIVIDEDDKAPANIREQIKKSVAALEQLSDAERLQALDAAASRLARISSEESIDKVADRLQSWLGLTPRAVQSVAEDLTSQEDAAEPAATEGEFDFKTAQLHDVRRVVMPNKRPQYLCVLLDTRGRTMEVPLSDAEGEPIYALMQKIKAHPLLEKIYRRIAMPLLDQMVAAERVAAERAAAATANDANSETDAHEIADRELPGLVPPADDYGP